MMRRACNRASGLLMTYATATIRSSMDHFRKSMMVSAASGAVGSHASRSHSLPQGRPSSGASAALKSAT